MSNAMTIYQSVVAWACGDVQIRSPLQEIWTVPLMSVCSMLVLKPMQAIHDHMPRWSVSCTFPKEFKKSKMLPSHPSMCPHALDERMHICTAAAPELPEFGLVVSDQHKIKSVSWTWAGLALVCWQHLLKHLVSVAANALWVSHDCGGGEVVVAWHLSYHQHSAYLVMPLHRTRCVVCRQMLYLCSDLKIEDTRSHMIETRVGPVCLVHWPGKIENRATWFKLVIGMRCNIIDYTPIWIADACWGLVLIMWYLPRIS